MLLALEGKGVDSHKHETTELILLYKKGWMDVGRSCGHKLLFLQEGFDKILDAVSVFSQNFGDNKEIDQHLGLIFVAKYRVLCAIKEDVAPECVVVNVLQHVSCGRGIHCRKHLLDENGVRSVWIRARTHFYNGLGSGRGKSSI